MYTYNGAGNGSFLVKCPRCDYVGSVREFIRFDMYRCDDTKTIDCEVWVKCPRCGYEEDIGRDYYPLE